MSINLKRFIFSGTLTSRGLTEPVTRKAIGANEREALVNLVAGIRAQYAAECEPAPAAAEPGWGDHVLAPDSLDMFLAHGLLLQPAPRDVLNFTSVALDEGAVVHRFGVHFDEDSKSVYAGGLKVATLRSSGWHNQVDFELRRELHSAVATAFRPSGDEADPDGETVAARLSEIMSKSCARSERAAAVIERAEEMLRAEYFEPEQFDYAVALLAAAEYVGNTDLISAETGLAIELVEGVVENLELSNFWLIDGGDKLSPRTEHWDDPPPEGAVAFSLWMLVAMGTAVARFDEDEA